MSALQPGAIVDRYRLDRRLGEGGMAVVYLATHVDLDTRHAVKLLHITSPAVTERMLQEGRIQAKLRHPNIVAVTDVLRHGDAPGLVMEFIEGPALDGLLRAYQPSLPQADELARGIIAGVQAAHQAGLIHRDLKPANILLSVEGKRIVPKIADFGLAKVLDDAGGGTGPRTRSGVTMGTPTFMAPEQLRDAKNVDHRADVFSLGCILYELVSGMPAFIADDLIEVYQATSQERYRPIRGLVPSIPARMEAAIDGALRADVEARFESCEALLDAWCGEDAEVTDPGAAWESEHLELLLSLGPSSLPDGDDTGTLAPSEITMAGPGSGMPGAPPQLGGPTAVPPGSSAGGVSELDGWAVSSSAPAGGAARVEPPGPPERRPGLPLMWVAALGVAGVVMFSGAALVATALLVDEVPSTTDTQLADDIDEPHPEGSEDTGAGIAQPGEVIEARPGTDEAPSAASETPATARSPSGGSAERPGAAADEASPAGEAPDEPVATADATPVSELTAPTAPADTRPAAPVSSFALTGIDRGYLVGTDGKRHRPGAVPAGDYTLWVYFDPAKPMKALDVTINEGQLRTIECVSMMRTCQ